jgi:hypothetical protein
LKTKLNSPPDGDTDWGEVFRRLTLFAYHRLGVGADLARAEELASETISRFILAHRGADDKIGSLNLASNLCSIMENLLDDNTVPDAIRSAQRFIPPQSVGCLAGAQQDSDAPALSSPISLLAKQIAGDRLMEGIVLLSLDGILDPSAQAVHLMSSIAEIYEARKRFLRVVARIRVVSNPKVSP